MKCTNSLSGHTHGRDMHTEGTYIWERYSYGRNIHIRQRIYHTQGHIYKAPRGGIHRWDYTRMEHAHADGTYTRMRYIHGWDIHTEDMHTERTYILRGPTNGGDIHNQGEDT